MKCNPGLKWVKLKQFILFTVLIVYSTNSYNISATLLHGRSPQGLLGARQISLTERFQRRILDCCNIQSGALCDNSQRLEAVNYCRKELHLGCCSNPRSASGFKKTVIGFYLLTILIKSSIMDV